LKKTFIQILVGAAVVVTGLVALNKFVPNFTLFPDSSQFEVNENEAEKENDPNEIPPAAPIDDTESNDRNIPSSSEKPTSSSPMFEDDEEESSIRINEIPKGVAANQVYSLDKRLRAASIGVITPLEIIKSERRSYTNEIFNEVCPTNIKNYHKDFAIYFDFLDDKLVESILFLSVEINKTKYVFKAQKGHNKLVIPNNLKIGRHQITFGYFLKKDIINKKIPYYAKNCMITIK